MHISKPLATLLTAAAATTALSATGTAPAAAAPAPSAPSVRSVQTLRAQVLKLTNDRRVAAGCPRLKASPALTRAAQRHSADMARHDFFDHTGSNGSTLVDRAENAGYTGWNALAENIAGGQRSAAAVVRSWMKSPGHRANILNCSLEHLGVGYVKKSGTQHVTYWTQDFGSKF